MSNAETGTIEYMTMEIDGQLFGLPINNVQDVFNPENMTKVPLANREIAGVLNLRGRIVTAIDMRKRLDLPDREPGQSFMSVGIESKNESYGLLIDAVGEVLRLKVSEMEPNPANLEQHWAQVSSGVYRLEGQLLVVLDVDRVLDLSRDPLAA